MEGEGKGEKHQCVVASPAPPNEDLDCSPGMCPDWESNLQPFGSQVALNPLSHTSQGISLQSFWESSLHGPQVLPSSFSLWVTLNGSWAFSQILMAQTDQSPQLPSQKLVLVHLFPIS